MIEKSKKDHFKSLMNMVFQELISWKALAFIFKDMTSNQESSKQVIEFLLEEIQTLYSRGMKDVGSNATYNDDEEFIRQENCHIPSNETDDKSRSFSDAEETNHPFDEVEISSQNDQNLYDNGFHEIDKENLQDQYQDDANSLNYIQSKLQEETFQMVQYEKDCLICGERFEKVDEFELHKNIHNVSQEENEPLKDFESNQLELEIGITNKENVGSDGKSTKIFHCQFCLKRCRNFSTLQIHERIHTGEKPFNCYFCPKSFPAKSNLRKHERMHTGEKLFKCKFCNKSFVIKQHLFIHERFHTGEKPYGCKVCNKCFSNKSNLNTHERIHTGEKPYKCQYCDKKFVKICNLNDHERIHTGEKPYGCNSCQRTFNKISNLKKHERRHKKVTNDD